MRPGDLFDTDVIGPFGYCANISRTFRCSPGKPTTEQKWPCGLAYKQIETNIALLKPGLGLREIADKIWKLPPKPLPGRHAWGRALRRVPLHLLCRDLGGGRLRRRDWARHDALRGKLHGRSWRRRGHQAGAEDRDRRDWRSAPA
ncbi:MAG: hypothetical protein GDA41_04200 [Rhodospirillales bacterium]|nr:hypothetical protein [Rhodospirillales bacterium]